MENTTQEIRQSITYNDIQDIINVMRNSKPTEFTNRFYCTEFAMLYDNDIEELYPKSKKKRIKIANKSNDRYLVTWRGLKFYLLPDTTMNQMQILSMELKILFLLIKNKLFSCFKIMTK